MTAAGEPQGAPHSPPLPAVFDLSMLFKTILQTEQAGGRSSVLAPRATALSKQVTPKAFTPRKPLPSSEGLFPSCITVWLVDRCPAVVLDLQIFLKELFVFTICEPLYPKNPSNAEYPDQNTVGALLKGRANWATHLVRFKNKTNKKLLNFSLLPTSRFQRWGWGVGQSMGTFKKLPWQFWVQASLEEQRGE